MEIMQVVWPQEDDTLVSSYSLTMHQSYGSEEDKVLWRHKYLVLKQLSYELQLSL